MINDVASSLRRDEGLALTAYPDALSPLGKAVTAAGHSLANYQLLPDWKRLYGGPWTIGYGETDNVHQGDVWTPDQAESRLESRVVQFTNLLNSRIPWVTTLDPVRHGALVNMTYNMGIGDLVLFHQFLAYMQKAAFEGAAADLETTSWYHQVGDRAKRLQAQISSAPGNK